MYLFAVSVLFAGGCQALPFGGDIFMLHLLSKAVLGDDISVVTGVCHLSWRLLQEAK